MLEQAKADDEKLLAEKNQDCHTEVRSHTPHSPYSTHIHTYTQTSHFVSHIIHVLCLVFVSLCQFH